MNVNDATPDTTEAEQSRTQEPLAAEQAPEQSAPTESAPAAEQQEDAQFTTEQPVTEQAADQAVSDPSAEASPEDGGTESENAGGADPEEDAETDEERLHRLEAEGDIAADYLEGLLDIADLDGDIDIDVDGDRASVEISGADKLARLNRPKGELLDALQELARLAVQTRTGSRSRLMLDIGGFRAEHKDSLEGLAASAIAEAKESATPVPMRPMNPFERKVVHDVAKREGLRSESDGDGKNRHVVIYPAS
ncbi:protein jag [Brachybacterium sp.]|jgi:spoIIIJ-associated protein|uniref:Jag family protein n=1 Tax=Brachybacterium sp. TaxID=1891286 RepID=UPI002ED64FA1